MKRLAILLLAGCGGGATSQVAVTFKMSTANPSVGSGLSGPAGSWMDASGMLTLMAQKSKSDPTLLVILDGAGLAVNVPVNVGERHLDVEYDLPPAMPGGPQPGFSSVSGSITFTSVSPYVINFNDVGMHHATPNATGDFTLAGVAEFTP